MPHKGIEMLALLHEGRDGILIADRLQLDSLVTNSLCPQFVVGKECRTHKWLDDLFDDCRNFAPFGLIAAMPGCENAMSAQ